MAKKNKNTMYWVIGGVVAAGGAYYLYSKQNEKSTSKSIDVDMYQIDPLYLSYKEKFDKAANRIASDTRNTESLDQIKTNLMKIYSKLLNSKQQNGTFDMNYNDYDYYKKM